MCVWDDMVVGMLAVMVSCLVNPGTQDGCVVLEIKPRCVKKILDFLTNS